MEKYVLITLFYTCQKKKKNSLWYIYIEKWHNLKQTNFVRMKIGTEE